MAKEAVTEEADHRSGGDAGPGRVGYPGPDQRWPA